MHTDITFGCMQTYEAFKFTVTYTVIGTSVLTKPILCYKRPNFTMPFYYVKVPKSKNELTYVQVGQKRPFTQKIRSLAQKWQF